MAGTIDMVGPGGTETVPSNQETNYRRRGYVTLQEYKAGLKPRRLDSSGEVIAEATSKSESESEPQAVAEAAAAEEAAAADVAAEGEEESFEPEEVEGEDEEDE
jgi:hypothetical protein